jgi:replicative DNA helicase
MEGKKMTDTEIITQAEIEAVARSRYRREWAGIRGFPVDYEATMERYRAGAKEDLEAAAKVRLQSIKTAT